jgi:hypothetical protein
MRIDQLLLKGSWWMLDGALRALSWQFERRARAARRTSRATLARILSLNGATEFGRQHGLAGRDALAAFRDHPLTTYQDYAPFLERAAAGERAVLTRDEITYFLVTAGTTGVPKMIPVTKRQSRLMAAHMLAPMGFAIRDGTLGPMSGRWMMLITTPARVQTPSGIERCTASSAAVGQIRRIFDRVLSSPSAVIQTTGQSVSRYLHFLFALREPDLWCAISPYPSILLNGFRNLKLRAAEFLRDLSDGTISPSVELPQDRRRDLAKLLGKHPARARALTALLERDQFVASGIWPRLGAVLTANSGAFHFYTDQLEPYLGGVKVFSPSLTASEGVVGVGLSVQRPGYAVSPVGAYVEFLPAGDAGASRCALRSLDEVEEGGVYEVVITTYAGLTRYRLGDLVKVLGWYGETPIVDFIERRGQLLDVASEKVTESQVVESFKAACSQVSMQLVDFVLTIDGEHLPPRYLLLIEQAEAHAARASDDAVRRLLQAFDAELCARSFYQFARKGGALLPMAALALDHNSFERFNEHRIAQGASPMQLKMPHVVPDPTFASRHFGQHRRIELPDDRLGVAPASLY